MKFSTPNIWFLLWSYFTLMRAVTTVPLFFQLICFVFRRCPFLDQYSVGWGFCTRHSTQEASFLQQQEPPGHSGQIRSTAIRWYVLLLDGIIPFRNLSSGMSSLLFRGIAKWAASRSFGMWIDGKRKKYRSETVCGGIKWISSQRRKIFCFFLYLFCLFWLSDFRINDAYWLKTRIRVSNCSVLSRRETAVAWKSQGRLSVNWN